MRLQKGAHPVERSRLQFRRLLPGIDRHLGVRAQRGSIDRNLVRVGRMSSGMTSIGVWHERAKSRDTLYTKSGCTR